MNFGWLTNNSAKLFGILFFAGLVLLVNWSSISRYGNSSYTSQEGVSPVIQSTTKTPPVYALHILFIGNSFTFYHDIPRQLADIASADPGNTTQFFVQSVTLGGIGLKELWDDSNAIKAIQNNRWDYVVIQQRSSWALSEVENTYDYSARFNNIIKASGAKTLLYLTWVNKPGSHWYSDPAYGMRDPDYVLRKLIFHTYKLAEMLDAQVVPVGIYWTQALIQRPEIEMYEADEHHPSIAGSYLSALVFYKTLTGRDVTKITFSPSGVSTDTDKKIKMIAAQPLPQS